jgi:hypothetical protein
MPRRSLVAYLHFCLIFVDRDLVVCRDIRVTKGPSHPHYCHLSSSSGLTDHSTQARRTGRPDSAPDSTPITQTDNLVVTGIGLAKNSSRLDGRRRSSRSSHVAESQSFENFQHSRSNPSHHSLPDTDTLTTRSCLIHTQRQGKVSQWSNRWTPIIPPTRQRSLAIWSDHSRPLSPPLYHASSSLGSPSLQRLISACG